MEIRVFIVHKIDNTIVKIDIGRVEVHCVSLI